MNGVRFSCGYAYHEEHLDEQRLYSYGGRFGRPVREEHFCEGYVTGIQMKSQSPQGQEDDVASINLKVFCDDGSALEGYDEEEDYYKDSNYTEPVQCPENMGVCGLSTQVQRARRRGDNTSLNNIRIRCCKVPQWVEEHKTTTTTTTTTEAASTTTTTTETLTEEEKATTEKDQSTTTTSKPVASEEPPSEPEEGTTITAEQESTTTTTTTTTEATNNKEPDDEGLTGW